VRQLIKILVASAIAACVPAYAATEINYWFGVVFPAIPTAAEISVKQMAAKGADVSAFIDEAKQPDGTFFLPISQHANDVVRILRANFDAIFLEGADVSNTLNSANKEVNALFE
jgi:multiple sugar transport system substrate-binding protein